MASPFCLFIVPNCGLSVSVDVRNHTYKIKDESKHEFIFMDESTMFLDIWQGKLSPVADLNLPPYAMAKAGIKSSSKKVAFLYPPPTLAAKLDWRAHHEEIFNQKDMSTRPSMGFCLSEAVSPKTVRRMIYEQNNDNYKNERTWALPYFSMLGAYVYFNDDMEVVCINTLSMIKTRYALKLAGPFQTIPEIVRSLKKTGRTEKIPLTLFHEAGFLELVSTS